MYRQLLQNISVGAHDRSNRLVMKDDPFFKVRDLVKITEKGIAKPVKSCANQSLDEFMMYRTGFIPKRQFCKGKKNDRGAKFYNIACSKTG